MKDEIEKFYNFKSQQCPIGPLIVHYKNVLSEIDKIDELISKINEHRPGINDLRNTVKELIIKMESI